jgi:hypothetical protein
MGMVIAVAVTGHTAMVCAARRSVRRHCVLRLMGHLVSLVPFLFITFHISLVKSLFSSQPYSPSSIILLPSS